MDISIGISTCPNDTFIFDALLHKKIDTEGLDFILYFDDIEKLNSKAINNELDLTKLSFNAFASLTDKYVLLTSGSALGKNCGPILISKNKCELNEINNKTIAIPGKNTTANLLLSIAFPKANNKTEIIFSDIENQITQNSYDLGLIIHESRFTYLNKGLIKIIDLGEYWETNYHLPIPLGGIAVKRSFPIDIQKRINRVIRKSVEFAFNNPKSSLGFIKKNAQEMEEDVLYKHIELYVNKYSLDLGEEGINAIKHLFFTAKKLNIIDNYRNDFYLNM